MKKPTLQWIDQSPLGLLNFWFSKIEMIFYQKHTKYQKLWSFAKEKSACSSNNQIEVRTENWILAEHKACDIRARDTILMDYEHNN